MRLAVAATVFALLFPAELPDKTALASLILGSRYRPGFVFAGAAFALRVAFAVAVGSLLTLLPHRAVEVVVAVLFLAGALLLLRGRSKSWCWHRARQWSAALRRGTITCAIRPRT